MAKVPAFDPFEFLVNRKFGRPGSFAGVSGIDSAERQARKDAALNRKISEYKAELRQLPSDRFEALVKAEREKQTAEISPKVEREESERFFNQPYSNADFAHWSKAAHWTLDEAIALSFGKAPEHVTYEKVKPYLQISAFAVQYHRRRDLAVRALTWKQLFDPVLPGLFLAWAKRNDLAVSPALEAAVMARGTQIADWKTLYDELQAKFAEHHKEWMELSGSKTKLIESLRNRLQDMEARLLAPSSTLTDAQLEKTLGTRERESLLKLIIGMAVGGYGYDPRAARSEQPSAIASDLIANEVPLDVDTVRKWLKEAAELLPQKNTE